MDNESKNKEKSFSDKSLLEEIAKGNRRELFKSRRFPARRTGKCPQDHLY